MSRAPTCPVQNGCPVFLMNYHILRGILCILTAEFFRVVASFACLITCKNDVR
jgi:hypothetical protein